MGRLVGTFGIIGLGVTLVYQGLANILNTAGLSAAEASIIAYAASTSLSYFGHRKYTFGSKERHGRTVPRFVATTLVGLALATVIPMVTVRYGLLDPAPSFILVTLVVALFSFVMMRLVVFPSDRS